MDRNQVAVSVFNQRAESYAHKYMDVTMYSKSFEFLCNTIQNSEANILDVACGPGNISKHIINKRPDWKINGIDLAPQMIQLARDNNPTANFIVGDCRDLLSLPQNYDAIISGFFFPYLSKAEVVQFISDSSKKINKGGLLYISTMEDDYENSGHTKGSSGDEIYMHYHEEGYISEALIKNNFKIIYSEKIKSVASDNSDTTDLILIAKSS